MQRQSSLGNNISIRVGLGLIVSLASLGAATLGLIYPSIYSPLLFLGAVAAAAIFIVWIKRPVLALYAALFMVLLPVGIMPLEIHSLLNRLLTVIAFGVWVLNILMKRKRNFWTGTAYVMLAFLIWGVLTTLLADNLKEAFTTIQVYILRFVVFIFLIPNTIRTKENLNGFFKTVSLSGWVLLGFGLFSLIQGGYNPGSRLQILGINANAAGTLGLITLSGVLWVTHQLSQQKRVIKAISAVVFLLLLTVIIITSGSRGGTISLAITIIAFWFWRPLRPWAILCISILILAMIFEPSLFTTVIERFLVQSHDTLLGGRETLWAAAWQMISEHPLTGVGIGNSRFSIIPLLNTADYGYETGRAIHNPILVIWSETGLLGILLYLGILISAVFSFMKQYLHYRNIDAHHPFLPYFAIVSSIFLGYMASWIKGGGAEYEQAYFFMLATLLIPSGIDYDSP